MNPARLKAYTLLLVVALIWGAAAPVIKFTFEGIAPLPFLAYRFLISFVLGVFALSVTKNKLPRSLKIWTGIILYSILSTTIALGFLFIGLEKTTVLNLTLITLIAPLLIGVAGVIFLKETVTKREKIGSAIAFFGAALTVVEPVLKAGADFGELSGNILLLVYLFSEVMSIVILKKIVKHNISAYTLSHISFIIGFITLAPVTLLLFGPGNTINSVKTLQPVYHAGVWYMAILSGTVAYALRAKAQKSIEIGEAALFSYLTAIFSAPLAVLWLGEKITLQYIIGAVVIAVGVVIAEYRSKD